MSRGNASNRRKLWRPPRLQSEGENIKLGSHSSFKLYRQYTPVRHVPEIAALAGVYGGVNLNRLENPSQPRTPIQAADSNAESYANAGNNHRDLSADSDACTDGRVNRPESWGLIFDDDYADVEYNNPRVFKAKK